MIGCGVAFGVVRVVELGAMLGVVVGVAIDVLLGSGIRGVLVDGSGVLLLMLLGGAAEL